MQNSKEETLKPALDTMDTNMNPTCAIPSTYKDMIVHYAVDLATLPTE